MTEPLSADDTARAARRFLTRTAVRRVAGAVAATVGAIAIIEVAPPSRFSAAIFLATAVVYLAVLTCLARGRSQNVLLTLAAFGVVPAAIEGGLAAMSPPPPTTRYSLPYKGAHPVLGFSPIPSITVRAVKTGDDGRAIYDVTYTIDADGLRRTQSNSEGPTIAFFFDLMTFGEGVDDSQTLPQQFADQTAGRYHVVNLGVPGFGPQGMLRTLETGFRDDVLQPSPRFFVVQTAAWHAARAGCRPVYLWDTPRYALIDGKPVYKGPCATQFEFWMSRYLDESYLFRRWIQPIFITPQDDLDLYLAELGESIAIGSRKYAAQTIVLYRRTSDNVFAGSTYTDDVIMAALRQDGAVVLDIVALLHGEADLSIPGDGHPSPKMHRLLAAMLRETVDAIEQGKANRH